jgi:hypothetical protein
MDPLQVARLHRYCPDGVDQADHQVDVEGHQVQVACEAAGGRVEVEEDLLDRREEDRDDRERCKRAEEEGVAVACDAWGAGERVADRLGSPGAIGVEGWRQEQEQEDEKMRKGSNVARPNLLQPTCGGG